MAGKSIVEGVVGVIWQEGRLLVIRRAEGVEAAGFWCMPGGAVEPGETQTQALARELREEVGLEVEPVRELWDWGRPDGGLILHWWEARVRPGSPALSPDPVEVAEARWLTPDGIRRLQPLLESNRLFLDWLGQSPGGSRPPPGPGSRGAGGESLI